MKTVDEVVQYLTNVVFPLSYNNDPSVYSLFTIAPDDLYVHHMNGLNYMCGIRLTLKRARLATNSDQYSRNVLQYLRPEGYSSADATYDSEMKEPFGTTRSYYYTYKNSFNGKGGYVSYFTGNTTGPSALDQFEEMKSNDWFSANATISLTTELMFYNANYGTGLYMAVSLLVGNEGTATISEVVSGFQPQLYDSFKSQSTLTLGFILQALFQVFVYYDILRVLIKFVYHAIDLFTGKKVSVPANDVVTPVVLVFSLVSISYWYIYVLGRRDTFALPMTLDDFDVWAKYAQVIKVYHTINSVLIILMCIRNLVELNIQLPSFGILFATIYSAKLDILCTIIVLLFGFHAWSIDRRHSAAWVLLHSVLLVRLLIGRILLGGIVPQLNVPPCVPPVHLRIHDRVRCWGRPGRARAVPCDLHLRAGPPLHCHRPRPLLYPAQEDTEPGRGRRAHSRRGGTHVDR